MHMARSAGKAKPLGVYPSKRGGHVTAHLVQMHRRGLHALEVDGDHLAADVPARLRVVVAGVNAPPGGIPESGTQSRFSTISEHRMWPHQVMFRYCLVG